MVNRKIKIVVACGAAIAQSSMLQMMISSYLDKKKVNYEIQKCTFYELQNKVNSWNPDFVYTVGQPPFQMREGLHHDGMSIFTGVGRDKTLYDMIQKLEQQAKNLDLASQRDIMRAGGTDAGVMHTTRIGVRTGGVSVPCRYIHTPVEMADLKDAQDCVKLLTAFVQSKLESL